MDHEAPKVKNVEDKRVYAATIIQSFWRGEKSRQQYDFRQLKNQQLEDCSTYIVGNDPVIAGLAPYASNETIALIGTSGLRALSLISELSKGPRTPKLIIVDNSLQVVIFWRNLRHMVSQQNFRSQEKLEEAFREFLLQNINFYTEEEAFSYVGIQYEEPNAQIFFKQLVNRYGYQFIIDIIKNAVIFANSWSNPDLFRSIKRMLVNYGIDVVYAYPSNIHYCIPDSEVDKLFANLQILNPRLTIMTDCHPDEDAPMQVILTTESDPNKLRAIAFPSPVLAVQSEDDVTALTEEQRNEIEQLFASEKISP